MSTQATKQFDTLDNASLEGIKGGVSCFEGVLGLGGLGAVGGPWGVVGGVLVGFAGFCM